MPLPKGNKKTDNTRKYQSQFGKDHYKTAACKISIDKYNAFQLYAQSQEKTVSALLMAYIDSCISAADQGQD